MIDTLVTGGITRLVAAKSKVCVYLGLPSTEFFYYIFWITQGVYIVRWDFNEGFLFHVAHRINLPLDGARIR
jgi:hypothetical protein